MKIKVYLLPIILIFVSNIAMTQNSSMSVLEAKDLRNKVIEKSKSTTSIISDFEQYKHLDFLSNDIKSSGKLVYKYPNFIKWEYQSPFKYSAIFKNNTLYINDDGNKSDINLASHKTFKSLNDLIIKSVKGDMFDESKFNITYHKSTNNYIVSFVPLDKNMKSLIRKFVLKFDKVTLNVIEVKMIESSEDYTLLKFLNQILNEPVTDSEFSN